MDSILARLVVQISAQTAAFNNALAVSKKELGGFQGAVQGLNNSLKILGLGFGISEVVGAFKDGIQTLAQFEQQVATVASITGASGKELDSLRQSALDLGASTKFTATEVAELQTEFGRLGFSTAEILQATDATLALSAATGESLAKSADIAGSTLRAFGKDASETGNVADIMAESFNKSALGLDNYGEAIKYVAPIAASANISLEETTALLGTLADNGIRGSMAGTSLRKIISDLGTANGSLSERLKEVAARGLSQADAMDEVGRTAYASLLILAKNTEKTDALAKSLKNSAGAAQEAADIMGDNLNGDLDRLSSSYDSLVLSGGAFTESLRGIAQAATVLLDALNNAAGSGIGKFLNTLIQYTPTLAGVANAINAIAYAASSLDKKIAITTQNLNRANAAADPDAIKKYTEELKDLRAEVDKQIKSAYAHRQAAIQDKDATAVKKYTQEIADLTAKYGLLRDKAVEFREELEETQKFAGVTVDTYTTLQNHLASLNQQFEASDLSDKTRLAQIGKYIIATKAEIEEIDALREAEKKKNDEKERSIKLYDAERGNILGIADAYNRNNEEIKKNQETIAKFLEGVNPLGKAGTVAKMERELETLNVALLNTFDPGEIIAYQKEIESLSLALEEFRVTGTSLADDIKAGKVGISQGLKEQLAALRTDVSTTAKEIIDLESLVEGAVQGVAEAFGKAIAVGSKDLGKDLLMVVANFAQQFGALMIAIGVGRIALNSGNPVIMLAAGAALVAAGAAIKAKMSEQKNLGSGTSLTGGGVGSSTATNGGTSISGGVQDVRLSATTVLKGQDIYIALSNYTESKKYTAASVGTSSRGN